MMDISGIVHRIGRYLDEHWVVRWFVVPIWFMALLLLLLFSATESPAVGGLGVIGIFLGFSFAVTLLGLLVERVVAAVTGRTLFNPNAEYEDETR
jgi:hypothetical protein